MDSIQKKPIRRPTIILPECFSVSFKSTAKVYKVKHINDFSSEEVNSTWYSTSELESIQAECTATIHMIMEGKQFDPNLYCGRGLEFRTPEGLEQRQWNRYVARNAVFTVQEDAWRRRMAQKNNNVASSTATIDETESLMVAHVYKKCSEPCQEAALQQGFQDMAVGLETGKVSSSAAATSSQGYSSVRMNDSNVSFSSSRWGGTKKTSPPKHPRRVMCPAA